MWIRALAALNPDVDDSRLRAGQELILPATAADLTAGLPAADRQEAPTTQMTVAPGDSLSAIACARASACPTSCA
ncbi:MAG: LysM domain-containing protein [Caldilineaceae bacterium]